MDCMRRALTAMTVLLTTAGGPVAASQDFALQVGPPIAASPQPGSAAPKKAKGAVFVVRSVGCADPAGAQILATAEGLVDGVRESIALTLEVMAAPGVHGVYPSWPATGTWIVSLSASCAGRTAGALVTLGPRNAYRRDAVELVASRPTPAQIEQALHAATGDQPAATARR